MPPITRGIVVLHPSSTASIFLYHPNSPLTPPERSKCVSSQRQQPLSSPSAPCMPMILSISMVVIPHATIAVISYIPTMLLFLTQFIVEIYRGHTNTLSPNFWMAESTTMTLSSSIYLRLQTAGKVARQRSRLATMPKHTESASQTTQGSRLSLGSYTRLYLWARCGWRF